MESEPGASSGGAGDELVWYAAYGSNLCADRLRCYLEGGRPQGAIREHVGARDPRPPRATRPVWLEGALVFARDSVTWGGGGVAFHDPDAPGRTAARAHLVTIGQFSDIVRQESRRRPGGDLDLRVALAGGRTVVGSGWYDTVLSVGRLDGTPMLTLTAGVPAPDGEVRAPGEAYLATIAAGLAEAHGWHPDEIARYLITCRGVAPSWDAAQLESLAERCVQPRGDGIAPAG